MKPVPTSKTVLISFGNLGIGGIQTKIVTMSEYLLRTRGDTIRIHLVLRDTPAFNLEQQMNLPGVIIHHRPQFLFLHIPYTMYYLWKVVTIQPDIILSFLDFLSSLAVISTWLVFWKHIRVVLNEDTLPSEESRTVFHTFLIRTFYPYADDIIVPTRAVQSDLISHFAVPKEKITVIANWTTMTRKIRPGRTQYDLLYAGRFEKQKNLLLLLRALRQLTKRVPGVKLCLVGEGSEKRKIQAYIEHHHLSHNVILHNSNHEISKYLDWTKLFVLSSYFEGMPVALLEAMARDCPAVSMRYPGVSECLINGKTGFITDSVDEFVEKTHFLLTHPKQRRRMGRAAGISVRTHFSEDPLRHFVHALIG